MIMGWLGLPTPKESAMVGEMHWHVCCVSSIDFRIFGDVNVGREWARILHD